MPEESSAKTTIVVAVIGAVGAVGAALIPSFVADKAPPATIVTLAPEASTTPAPAPTATTTPPAVTKHGASPAAIKHGPPPAIKAAIAADEERLRGRWAVVSIQVPGKKELNTDEPGEANLLWFFHGDELTLRRRVDGKMVVQNQGTFKIHRGGGHRSFDFISTGTEGRPVEFYGIYEFEGESLKICYRTRRLPNDPVPERPSTFVAGAERGGAANLRLKPLRKNASGGPDRP